MARDKAVQQNIDNSNPANYPNGRIKNNTGGNDGTPVNEQVYGDIHETLAKATRLYGIAYNGLPDNEANGYQLLEAIRALASKNDFVLDMSSSSNVLMIPIKLGKMLANESVILKAAVDKTTQTQIKGTLDNETRTVTFLGDFKATEYVRMIVTNTSVVLIRLIDSFNLNSAVADLGFLTSANQAEENAGTTNTKATTPLTNKSAYSERVNGASSSNYLAIETSQIGTARNGLMTPADKQAIQDFNLDNIKITSDSNVAVLNWQDDVNNADNFLANYVDVAPPAGKTIADLKGFMASHSRVRFDGDVNDDDYMWCRWALYPTINPTSVRVICGATELEEPPRLNYLGIWI